MENNNQTQWPVTVTPKPLLDLSKRDVTFALFGVMASVFWFVSGVCGGLALGYTLSALCMLILFTVYFAKNGKISAFAILCGALAFANSAVFLCTGNGGVRFFSMVASFFLSLVYVDGFANGKTVGNRGMTGLFFRAATTTENIGITIKSLFSDGDGKKKTIGKVLVGLLFAIPVLLVVVPLLRSSDDAFRGMMNKMFQNAGATIFKALVGAFISIFVVTYGITLKLGHTTDTKESKFAGVENAYMISFLSAISVCYLLYLFSQLAYFFSAFRGFLPDGEITYAQYARKGFFEMCIIAVINLTLVFIALLLSKKQNGKVCHGIKALTTFIGCFTLVIIATAISKMVLYIDAYGMTVLRLTTSAFMVFLTVVFISLILRIYITKINIVKTGLLAAGCILLLLGTVNVNRVCAQYNYNAYKTGKLQTVDVEAMYNLGYEGIPYIVELASSEDEAVATEAKNRLKSAYLYHYFEDVTALKGFTLTQLQNSEKNNGFSCFSIPRKAAYDSLYAFLEENPDFSEYCKLKKG